MAPNMRLRSRMLTIRPGLQDSESEGTDEDSTVDRSDWGRPTARDIGIFCSTDHPPTDSDLRLHLKSTPIYRYIVTSDHHVPMSMPLPAIIERKCTMPIIE